MKKELSKKWSDAVRDFWNGICPHCGYKNESCVACHIVGRSNGRVANIVENGIWGCHDLHRRMEKGEEYKKKVVEFYCQEGLYNNLEKIRKGISKAKDFGYTEIN